MRSGERYCSCICDLVVQSNIFFPELAAVEQAIPNCRFDLLPAAERIGGDVRWYHHWKFPDEPVWLSFGRVGDGYLLRFPDHADFLVSADATAVKCYPLPGTAEVTIRHLFLDQVFPLLLSRQAALVFHASAVLAGEGVIAFVAKTGCGKSTLAASFAQDGYPFVSDDYLVLRKQSTEWLAFPSYPGVRLWHSSTTGIFREDPPTAEVADYTSKQRVSSPDFLRFADQAAPLRAVFFLDEGENTHRSGISIEPVAPRNTFVKLLGSVFNIDISDADLLRQQFMALESLRAEVPLFKLAYPREFRFLPEVHRTITNLLRSSSEGCFPFLPARG